MTFRWTAEAWGEALRCSMLEPVAAHFFTTRHLPLGQSMTSGEDGWAKVAAAAGVPLDRLRRVRQVHGAAVVIYRGSQAAGALDREERVEERPEADVIASDDPSIALAVETADCVPILIGDPQTGAVAAVHAGWRGTAARAARSAVSALTTAFGARPSDLVAAIGPSIGPCCYQVGPELAGAFEAAGHDRRDLERWFSHHNDPPAGLRLDLWLANRDQLVAEGLAPAHVHVSELCTATRADLYWSFRRDGAAAGRVAAVIRPTAGRRPAG